jgi:hypothetical protein
MKKRMLILPFLACVLILWHLTELSFASKDKNSGAAQWEVIPFKTMTGKQEKVLVLRLWDSAANDPKWPQLALLRLPPAVYKEFQGNSSTFKAFVDGSDTGKPIFNAAVTITQGCKLPEPEDQQPDDDFSWVVTINHRTSRCSCSAFPEYAIGAKTTKSP